MGETVLLYNAAAILSACVAALGFKIAVESKGGISINNMVADLAKSIVPGFKVIVGTAAMGLNPGLFYAYMQVVNGKTSVPQSLISWIQNWLSQNGAYDAGKSDYYSYTDGSQYTYDSSLLSSYTLLESQFDSSLFNFSEFSDIISHFSLDLNGKLVLLLGNYSSVSEYVEYGIFLREAVPTTFKAIEFNATNEHNHYFGSGVDFTGTVYSKIVPFTGTNTRYGSQSGYSATWFLTPYIRYYNGHVNIEWASNYNLVTSPNDSGLEAGENVPGKDVVIPEEGDEGVDNAEIKAWLKTAVGAAVASALGIGIASIPFIPVGIKNPAITGDITDALDNASDQTQDVAQEGATDTDTVATGEKYANTSLAPSKPSGNISASSLYTIWNPSQTQLNTLANFLWSTDFVDTIKKILQSPMDALISLALFPVNPPTDGTRSIALGYIDSGVAAPRVSDQFMTVQTSGLVVPHKYNSYLDYAPYTKAEIFLPFIGFCPLNINDIMGKSVDVTYNIDLLSGVCTAIVHANAQSLYSYSGNMAMFLPLSAGNWARMLTPIFGMVGGVTSLAAGIGGVMGGAPLLASTSMAVRGAESIGNLDGNSVSRSGGISGNAGIMGDYQPFIVVTRPINDKPSTYDNNIGQTYNKSAQLGTLSGFTVVEEAHIEGMNATDTEKQEIERLLKEGVIL